MLQLSENELTVQAIRLELAVHKLSNRGYDKIAEEFSLRCSAADQEAKLQGDSSPQRDPHNQYMDDQRT